MLPKEIKFILLEKDFQLQQKQLSFPYYKMLEKIKNNQKEFFILGTAHVSKESVKDVENAIAEIQPDRVCVELCDTRYKKLKDKNRWKELDIIQIIKQKKNRIFIRQFTFVFFSKKNGKGAKY